jgi:hypothetical protein
LTGSGFSINLLCRPTKEESVTPRHGWERLARILIDRRGELDPVYKSRLKFAADTGLNERLISDLENARRTSYRGATLRAVEVAYRWAPGSIARVVEELGEPTPLDKGQPAPTQALEDLATIEDVSAVHTLALRQRAPWLVAELHRLDVDVEGITQHMQALRDIGARFGYSVGDLLLEAGTVTREELQVSPTYASTPLSQERLDAEIARLEADRTLSKGVKKELIAAARKLREARNGNLAQPQGRE